MDWTIGPLDLGPLDYFLDYFFGLFFGLFLGLNFKGVGRYFCWRSDGL